MFFVVDYLVVCLFGFWCLEGKHVASSRVYGEKHMLALLARFIQANQVHVF